MDERLAAVQSAVYGQYEKLIVELREEDPRGYKNYMRISSELFQELVERVGPKHDKKDTLMTDFTSRT